VPIRKECGAGNGQKGFEMNKVPMTVGGFEALKEELRWRQQEERPRIIEAISEARSHGDLSENAEYHAAKESQSLNEGRVNELEDLDRARGRHRRLEAVGRKDQVRRDRGSRG
jgi:hypothetical protein